MNDNDRLFIDLTDIAVEEVEILAQEGSRGLAEFAASSGDCSSTGTCSCSTDIEK
jgi:hypothetical protein